MMPRRIMLTAALLAVAFETLQAQDEAVIRDKEVTVAHFEELKYPALAIQTGSEGAVVVRVKLDKTAMF